jgi:class 3 adenylate cyclase
VTESAAICARIREQLDHGAPWDACDSFREAVADRLDDAELVYLGALAHARAGATHEARALLDRAKGTALPPARQIDILSLRGRLWKDALHRAPERPDAATIAARARDEYLAAYAIASDPYPGVNAATLSMVLGDCKTAQEIAAKIDAGFAGAHKPRSPWDLATAGEAQLLLGQHERARDSYAAAYASMGSDAGSVASMRRQLRLLARVLPDAATLLQVLRASDVVAVSGHMIDAPGRAQPRFPPALETAVEAAIREHLRGLDAPTLYTSAASGSDLIAIEQALALGAEVNVVLPFDRDDFVRVSVAPAGTWWVPRFERALDKAQRVIVATGESYLGDDALFEHAALQVEGLARLRAAQLEASPTLVCVMDATQPGGVGGTRASYDRWNRNVGPPHVIDLSALRASHGVGRPSPTSFSAPSAVSNASNRTLKTMLFADVAGYSKLPDARVSRFQQRFWATTAREIEALPAKPLLANTWGDALYLVFESPQGGADFALQLLDAMGAPEWDDVGLPGERRIRIALHTGAVFHSFDPVQGRDNYFGSAVNLAARIEPITPPGTVYASEAFAASLAATGADGCALEYTGALPLAKGYGESRIFRLERR